ncbi:AAA family ATPase [Crocosphaera sp. UHCC 0190]|uniref:AAA family ATPase n=1 Tax=Crocosphaera sp. UHCC 0190 TaxID=3110246 RepID=UPI002B1F1184|nr:AAA family ATPase [Crocosphaera sp. UHCC 0190]MEA5512117.1 AAA family ATPase [Crocosphaera sp. UHCC 0190]
MKFEISNLGYIKQAEIELGDLTIICGKNNTGKTYVNYAIYGFFTAWKSRMDFKKKFDIGIENKLNKLFEDGFLRLELSNYYEQVICAINDYAQLYSEKLNSIFNIDRRLLSNVSLIFKINGYQQIYTDNTNININLSPESFELSMQLQENDILEILFSASETIDERDIALNKSFIRSQLRDLFFSQYFPSTFIITSERTGVSLFYKELDAQNNMIFEEMKRIKNINSLTSDEKINVVFRLINQISRYSQPIQDEINFVRDLDTISKRTGELAKNNPEIIKLLTDIIGGDYSVTDYSMSFTFTEDNKQQEIPLYSASSTVKSLVNLYFYLKHLAKPGDILIIDEPELNLHPENQRKLAKLFTRLTKCGLKLLMTTHSDYLIKELNNLIVLNNDFDNKSKLMEQYNYTEQDILDPDKVRVYIAENHTLNLANITPLGIEVPTFDDEIINMTDFYDEVYDKVIDNRDI